MGISFASVMECIPERAVLRAVLKENFMYSGVKLIYAGHADCPEGSICVGRSANLPPAHIKGKNVGLVVVNDSGADYEGIERLELDESVDLFSLYDELKELWCCCKIGGLVEAFHGISPGMGLSAIVSHASGLLGNPVIVVNSKYQLIGSCCMEPIDEPDIAFMLENGWISPIELNELLDSELARRISESQMPVIVEPGQRRYRKRLLGMIRKSGKPQAVLMVLEFNRPLSPSDRSIVNSACEMIAQVLEKSSSACQAPSFIQNHESRLISLLEKGEAEDPYWIPGFLSYMRWNGGINLRVCTIINASGFYENPETSQIRSSLLKSFNCCLFLYERSLVMITPEETELAQFAHRHGLAAGVSNRFTDLRALKPHYLQAQSALRIGMLLNGLQEVHRYSHCWAYDLAQRAKLPLENMDEGALALLEAHDLRYGTDYIRTLQAFLSCACNKTRVAQELFVHRNTVLYGLAKIEAIIGADLNDGNECLMLHFALKARELLRLGELGHPLAEADG
ncbi:MAG: helix-turn-helix domain-containing protein [Clostridiales bacterium]|jgi:hypothetical protein|nr:helix-turn-helix domain-containing protein [Clostridiales bacterium]